VGVNRAEFWSVIEKSKTLAGDNGACAQAQIVQELLEQLEPTEIEELDRIYDELRMESYTSPLWAAAYIINGGCSDDGFEYFRGWLISRGQRVFEAAVNDPETLVSEVAAEGDYECEDMLYVAVNAYRRKTNEAMPDRPPLDWVLKGEEWNEDEVEALFPKLSHFVDSRGR